MEKITKYGKHERLNQDLIHSAQAGDESSLNKLLLNNQSMILRWLWNRTINHHHQIEDLVQEALLKISTNLYRYNHTVKFTSFCIMNTEQVWIDWLREVKQRTEPIDNIDMSAGDEKDNAVYIRLEKVVDQLKNEEMKAVLKMHLFEHQSNQQIVEQTGLTNTNVKTLISRGKQLVKNNYF